MFAKKTLTALFAAALSAAAATAQTAPKADLVIQDITFDSGGNEVTLRVKNNGNAKAENFRVRLQIVASVVGTNGGSKVLFDQAKTYNRVNAGDTEDKDFDVNFANIQAQADAFLADLLARVDQRPLISTAQKNQLKDRIRQNFRVNALATADSDNQVNELNENNNKRTETFPVQ